MNLPRLSKPALWLLITLAIGVPGYLTLGRFVLAHCMLYAARAGNVGELRLLILLGGSVNSHHRNVSGGGSALTVAASQNHEQTVAFLLERGAEPDIQDNNGYSPLIYAVMDGNQSMFAMLMQHHANPNLTERCRLTAYDYALQKQHTDMARKLQQAGGIKGKDGGCPLKHETILRP